MVNSAKHRPALRMLAWLWLLVFAAACSPGGLPNKRDPVTNAHLLVAEVFLGHPGQNGTDQYIRLHNPTEQAADLAGWSVGDAKVRAVFGSGARIGPQQSLYVARDAEGFRRVMGAPPAYVWGPTPAAGAQQLSGGAALTFDSSVGMVALRDPAGIAADLLVYGAVPAGGVPGWRGPAVPIPFGTGEVFDRARDEATWTDITPGLYKTDTDTAADWKQGSMWLDGRALRPGQTWFGYPTFSAGSVTAYATPDSTYKVVADALGKARRSIDLTVYDFTVVDLADKLAEAARRGVRVRLLMEAGSEGRLSDQERYIGQVVHQAGGEVRWVMNDPNRGYVGRYIYNHAKYAVIDGQISLVQSENLVRHGAAPNPTFGNRGWGILVEDPELGNYLSRVFEADWSLAYSDIAQFERGTPFGPPEPGFVPDTGTLTGQYPHPFPALTVRGPVKVTPVLAPDHTLLETKGIIGLIRSARESLYIEQQYAHKFWGSANTGSPQTSPDVFLEEAIQAARRGVKVRILLSQAFLDPKDPKDNTNTVAYVNDIARRERLDLEARILRNDLTALDKIHNKGIIVDERAVFVSSVNWSQNSPANNREVSLIVEHPSIGAYYADILTCVTGDTRN